tara:strand:+ start:1505 stop:2989 length:1485 start_codon:yes stop_codon:yes gene_type:complete
MKDIHQIQKDRIKYHLHPNKNTVHRSSLIAPSIDGSETWISFINHFLIKRGYKSIALKISAINEKGNLIDSTTSEINKPKVYSFNLTKMFYKIKTKNYLVEFFSEKNLFIPFPAVIITHFGKDFCNIVHSYNRILNDVFENDHINKTQVYETFVDSEIKKKYDVFFNFTTGITDIKNGSLLLNYTNGKNVINKKIKISLPRLTNKSFYISNIIPKKINGGIIKIKQPKQDLFYGRLLAGIVNKKTKAFSANHSYYDSSQKKEYFSTPVSYRTYPYFKNLLNKIEMYPIFSPSKLTVQLKIYNKMNSFLSKKFTIVSPSKKLLSINVNQIVESLNLESVTAFSLIASSSSHQIPSRVNHQIIYGQLSSKDHLKCSINVSLYNKSNFMPANKKGFTWGQFISHKDYQSKIAFCFGSSEGKPDKINIDFYNSDGLFKSKKLMLNPKQSLIFDSSDIVNGSKEIGFNWFVAKSLRPDLTAYSINSHKNSGNFSGEHSF